MDDVCARAEGAFGPYGAAAVIGLALLVAAAVYVTPALTTINQGNRFRALSIDPFDFSTPNDVQLRILTPLLAHYLFLRDGAYLFAPLLAGAAFLAAVYAWARRRGLSGAEATGTAALMAFSTPILFVLHFQGYVDTTSYLLVFLTLVSIEKPWLWPVFYALALLNHESNLFVAPLLLVAANAKSFRLSRLLLVPLLIAVAALPLLLYRHYAALHAVGAMGNEFYLYWDRPRLSFLVSAKFLPMGAFYAFKLFWLFPLVALAGARRCAAGVTVFLIVGFLCAAAQLALATDTSRLFGLAFPIVLVGALCAREQWGGDAFADRLWKLIGLNFLILPYYVGQDQALPFLPLPVSLALWFVWGIEPWLWWGGGW